MSLPRAGIGRKAVALSPYSVLDPTRSYNIGIPWTATHQAGCLLCSQWVGSAFRIRAAKRTAVFSTSLLEYPHD